MDFDEMIRSADKHKDRLSAEVARLSAEPFAKPMAIGDRVLVAVGPLGRGFIWERAECEIVELAETAVKVKSLYDQHPFTEWVICALVTDVLGPKLE